MHRGVKINENESAEVMDPFALYLKDISLHPILTRKEELRYARLANKGDIGARNYFIACNLRLVVKIARRYVNKGLSIGDLVSEGNLGLFKSIEKFKPKLGFKFSTYATWWINQAISHAIGNKARTIRVPIHVLNLINKYTEQHNKLPDTVRDKTRIISGLINVSEKKCLFINTISCDTVSYDGQPPLCFPNEEKLTGIHRFKISMKDDSPSPDILFEHLEYQDKLAEALNTLKPQEKDVLFKRYGFYEEKPHTLEEIGNIYNVSRERIRQVQEDGMLKLKAYFKERNMSIENYL